MFKSVRMITDIADCHNVCACVRRKWGKKKKQAAVAWGDISKDEQSVIYKYACQGCTVGYLVALCVYTLLHPWTCAWSNHIIPIVRNHWSLAESYQWTYTNYFIHCAPTSLSTSSSLTPFIPQVDNAWNALPFCTPISCIYACLCTCHYLMSFFKDNKKPWLCMCIFYTTQQLESSAIIYDQLYWKHHH